MYTFEELKSKYEPAPRKMDPYLRPLTLLDTGEKIPFPAVKLLLVTALSTGLSYLAALQLEASFLISLFVVCPVWMGVCIQVIRAASMSERNCERLKTGPFVLGRVVHGETRLYSQGSEPGLASVVFSTDDAHRLDELYLRDVAKRIRSAKESTSPADELMPAVTLVNSAAGQPVRLPNSVAADGSTWLGVVKINPERLPQNKVVGQQIPLLVAPESGLVAHL
ncbi:MAG: hypothetical protein VX589_03445 [Myxococcota bacterium]|nr:hypothetical protein [Myxococcota bacterium]